MRKITKFLLLILSLFIFSGVVVSTADEFVETGGAGYRVIERREENDLKFSVTHYADKAETKRDNLIYKQEVNTLEIPANSEAKIISYGNLSNHKWTLTTVSDLARQFEAENPDWKVLAAVNGDFFDINGNGNLPYQTNNALVSNGEFFKTSGSSAIGFKNDGSTNSLVGGTPKRTQYMVLAVYNEFDEIIAEFDVHKLNTRPGINETAVYFGTYGTDKKYVPKLLDDASNKFIVEAAELALPNNVNDFYGKGVISSKNDVTLQIGQFAILSNNADVISAIDVGDKIRVQYEFIEDFKDVTSVTGHNAKFVVDGEYSAHPSPTNNTHARHPRTVAGIKADGTIVLSIIDGRAEATGRSGMYGNEMAAFMKSLGVVEAYNLDGGGSSYMVVKENGQFVVKSSPSDGGQRRNGNALLVAVQVPHIEINVKQDTDSLGFNLNVINSNGFELNELYIKVGNITNKVINGKAEYINLNPDTNYFYELIYKNKAGNVDSLMIDGNIKTLKAKPIFKFIKIIEDDITFRVSVEYDDPNNASNIKSSSLVVNGKNHTLQNNEIIFLKRSMNYTFEKFDLTYSYNDNANTYEINIKNAPYRILTSQVTETLYEIFRIHNEAILNIYS